MANQLKIKVESEHVLTEAVVNGLDTSNVLTNQYKLNNSISYTATQDCFVVVFSRLYNNNVKLNNVPLLNAEWARMGESVISFFVKKGQTVSIGTYEVVVLKAFGIKR